MLRDLMQADPDVKLWLETTGYFDVEHRRQVLDKARNLENAEKRRETALVDLQNSSSNVFTHPSRPNHAIFDTNRSGYTY